MRSALLARQARDVFVEMLRDQPAAVVGIDVQGRGTTSPTPRDGLRGRAWAIEAEVRAPDDAAAAVAARSIRECLRRLPPLGDGRLRLCIAAPPAVRRTGRGGLLVSAVAFQVVDFSPTSLTAGR